MTTLFALLQAIPMRPPPPPPPPPEGPHPVETFLADYGQLLIPVVSAVVIFLVLVGVYRALRNDDLTGLKKKELKGEILRIMRLKVGGLTVVQVRDELEVKLHHAQLLLEELVEHGALEVYAGEERGDVYHVAGVGGSRDGAKRTHAKLRKS